MAEFCLDCWNKLNHIHLTEEDVTISEELDLCEGCGKMMPTIVCYGKRKKRRPHSRRRHKCHTAASSESPL